MKKRSLCLILSCLMLLVVLTACNNSSGDPSDSGSGNSGSSNSDSGSSGTYSFDPITIKVATPKPDTNLTSMTAYVFADYLESHSDGLITVEVYTSGSLVSDNTVLDAVKDGLCDIGYTGINYFSGIVPETLAPGVMGVYTSEEDFFDCMEREGGIHDLVEEQFLEKADVRIIGWVHSGGVSAYANTKRPVYSPDDTVGLNIRVASSGGASAIEAIGSVPMVIESADAYSALQSGLVDGVFSNATSVVNNDFISVVKYVTEIKATFSDATGGMVSEKTWQSWPAEVQELVMAAAEEAYAYSKETCSQMQAEYWDKIENDYDNVLEVYHLSTEELAPFIELMRPGQLALLEEVCTPENYQRILDIIGIEG